MWRLLFIHLNTLLSKIKGNCITERDILKAVKLATPYPRLGLPKDIANAAVFLASDMAEWVTGSILVVDGDWSAGEHFFPE
ncbi:MAG: SDR family oxidoreductase [Deltaproteobacteria bacterium]|nr:SDR family oxidoreductase [Deltaproteobacteria bacterium]